MNDIDKFIKHLGITGFGASIKIKKSWLKGYIVASTDGVGTKLLVAEYFNYYDTIGIDLVAMNINDILCHGASPIAFLDYYATGTFDFEKSKIILNGIKEGCRIANCPLVGGETSIMPDIYQDKDFDLAGTAIGVAKKRKHRPLKAEDGDYLIGIPSSGIHSNGWSALRQWHKEKRLIITKSWLTPTRIYTNAILPNLKYIKAIAHITGGGIHGNLPRILPPNLDYRLDFEYSDFFKELFKCSNMDKLEFESIFNCGIGMILVISPENLPKVLDHIGDAQIIGRLYD